MRTVNAWRVYLTQPATPAGESAALSNAVTETSGRADRPAPLFVGRGWVHFAWWLCAWNAAVPIRLIGILPDAMRRPGATGRGSENMIVDQTSWAVVTYVMFCLALRARHEPMRQTLTILGVL